MTSLTGTISGEALTGTVDSFTTYQAKIAAIESADLIGYWMLRETTGATADNYEGTAARDGTYEAVTLNSADGPVNGSRAPLFDGSTSYCDIYSTSLNTAFDGAEGTAAIWAKVRAASVWTDSTVRYLLTLKVDANNSVIVTKYTTDNTIRFAYEADNTVEPVADVTIGGSTAWNHLAITWSKSSGASGEVKAYINGVQVGTTQQTLGVWAGDLAATTVDIGAVSTVPASVWDGYLAHAAIWKTPLSAAQILTIATV